MGKTTRIYVAITNHGFGHVTRTAAVLAELQRRCPELTLIVVTTAPRWLLESYLTESFVYRPQRLDIGVIQQDSLTLDQAATLKALQALEATAPQLIETEAQFIRDQEIALVLGDIPPLAGPIAAAAGVPCWLISNFSWDEIYGEWGAAFQASVDWIRDCFTQCDRLFQLPFHTPMPAFRTVQPVTVQSVGLTGGTPRYPVPEIRDRLGLTTPSAKTVLLTFGGLGLNAIPYENLAHFPDWQFITFDANAPTHWPNLRIIDGKQYRPVDIMPACGRLIGKPGYGTFAEATRVGLPIICLPRADFCEAAALIAGMQQHCHHLLLEPGEFNASWDFLRRPLIPPQSNQTLATDGNEAIATAVLTFFGYQTPIPLN